MLPTTFKTLPLITILLLVNGCADYAVSVNSKTVYNPLKVFTEYHLDDINLQKCVDGIIASEHLTAAEDLRRVQCGPDGISQLRGLEIFSKITHLGLADNKIASIGNLAKFKHLQQVNLSGNMVKDIAPLFDLQHLTYINLSGSNAIACDQLAKLKQFHPEATLVPPVVCDGKAAD